MKKHKAGCLILLFAMTAALTGCSGTNKTDNKAEAINVGGMLEALEEYMHPE